MQEKLNVLFITGTKLHPFHIGGTEIATFHLATELARQECEISIITGQIPTDKISKRNELNFKIEEIKTGTLPIIRGILYSIGCFFKTLSLRKKIDIIHIQPLFPLGLLGITLGLIIKKSTIIWARGSDIDIYSKFKSLMKWVIKRATSVIALSSNQKRKMEALAKRKTIMVIPNGVEIPNSIDKNIIFFSSYLKELISSLPSSHILNTINSDTKIVLYVGRLEEFKGIRYLLRAIPHILKEIPNTLFLFVGNGNKRNDFLKLSNKISISNNTLFVKKIPHKELFNFYRNSDIFVNPSLREGVSNVVLEAMASGLPVVACKVGGTPDIIKNGETGLLINPENINQITYSLLKLLKSVDLRNLYGANAKNFVLNLSWDKIARRVINVYKNSMRSS
jgi:glycosyltransferase involved in cell wall biosynthesis